MTITIEGLEFVTTAAPVHDLNGTVTSLRTAYDQPQSAHTKQVLFDTIAHLVALDKANTELRTTGMSQHNQIGELTDTLREVRDQLTALRGNVVTDRTNAQAFKLRVREAVIDVQRGHSNHIGIAEMNNFLTRLGLDPVATDFYVTGTWKGHDLPGARISAADKEDAETMYRDALSEGEWSVALALSGSVRDREGVVFDSNHVSEEGDDDVDQFDVDEVEVDVEEAD